MREQRACFMLPPAPALPRALCALGIAGLVLTIWALGELALALMGAA